MPGYIVYNPLQCQHEFYDDNGTLVHAVTDIQAVRFKGHPFMPLITNKYKSRCNQCGVPLPISSKVSWTPGTKGVQCLACSGAENTFQHFADLDSQQEVYFGLLANLEEALLTKAERGATPEIATAWEKYQKLKALALQPGTNAEGIAALKQALLQLVKVVF